jgi:hypothetical protein
LPSPSELPSPLELPSPPASPSPLHSTRTADTHQKGALVMSQYVKLTSDAGDRYLTALAEVQENFLKSMTALTAWMAPAAPIPTPPFAAELPTPREVVETNFTFTEKLLKQQKAFVEKFFTASTPASAPS